MGSAVAQVKVKVMVALNLQKINMLFFNLWEA
jgi:hypothetical protein